MPKQLATLDKDKAVQLVAGNEQLADDLLAILIKELPDYKKALQSQLINNNFKNKNWHELHNIIHKIHGGLRYVGTPALIELIRKIDNELFNLSMAQVEKNMELIFIEIDKVIRAQRYK